MDLRRTDRRPDTKLPGVPQQEVKQELNEEFSEEEKVKVWSGRSRNSEHLL